MGGVISPIQVALTMIPPRWTRETPYSIAMGARIGVIIVVIGTESIKHPRNSKMSMTTIKNNTSLEVMDKSVFANVEAIRSLVKTQENAPDAPTISMILPVLFMAFPKHSSMLFQFISF